MPSNEQILIFFHRHDFFCSFEQTPLSYIQSHEHAIIDTGSSPGEPCDIFHSEASDMSGGNGGGGLSSGKRKLPDRYIIERKDNIFFWEN